MKPEPADLVKVTAAAAETLRALDKAARADPGMTLLAYLQTLGYLQDVATIVARDMVNVSFMAARVLTSDPEAPEPEAAGEARALLKTAAEHAGSGAGNVIAAHRELQLQLSHEPRTEADPGDPGPMVRLARSADSQMTEFDDEVAVAGAEPTAAMLAGYANITHDLEDILFRLAGIGDRLLVGVGDAYDRRGSRDPLARRADRVTGPLREVGPAMRRGQGRVGRAHQILADAARKGISA